MKITLTQGNQAVTKTFMHNGDNLDNSSVSLLAPTGIAAVNIDGTTIPLT